MKRLYLILLFIACISSTNNVQAQGMSEATFYTSMGEFTVELYDTLTPITVDSFVTRVARGFYDGLIFHRVMDNFMIQGGDPAGTGSGGTGTTIPDEFHPTLKNTPAMLSMANKNTQNVKNTGDCQFFINLVTNSHLDNLHTVFGKVKSNFNIVQTIGKTPTSGATGNPANKPTTDVTMDSVRITKFAASVEEYYSNSRVINISPNPSTGIFNIDIPAAKTQVVIMDMQGRQVLNVSTEYETKLAVDLSNESKGIYLVKMNTKDGATHGRIVVQ